MTPALVPVGTGLENMRRLYGERLEVTNKKCNGIDITIYKIKSQSEINKSE